MSDDREQAIKDVAEHSKYSEEQVRLKVNNALYWPLTEYAVAQRERVIALERALREIRDGNNDACSAGWSDADAYCPCNSCTARAALGDH